MGDGSGIQWTDATWNVTTGCDRISPGCDNCYALVMAKRLKAMGSAKYQTDGDPRTSGPGFGVTFHRNSLLEPLKWRKPRRVFVNSMSDLAHARISDASIAQVFAVMGSASRHEFQVLTKRPRRLAKLLSNNAFREQIEDARTDLGLIPQPQWPLPNVWLGTSIESNQFCWRADALRTAPAAVRFLSLEPLLGPLADLNLAGIDWVIVGGESGPNSRPMNLDWARDLRDQCLEQRVPFFFKQVGGRTPKAGGRDLDGTTWDELPATTTDTAAKISARPESQGVELGGSRRVAYRTLGGTHGLVPASSQQSHSV